MSQQNRDVSVTNFIDPSDNEVSDNNINLVLLINDFVETLLNAKDSSVVDKLFDSSYIDHHPFYKSPSGNSNSFGTRQDILGILDLLSDPDIDLTFRVEDVICSTDKIAYRLFGAGGIKQDKKLIGVSYESIGIFKVKNYKFVERWGPIIIRTEGLNT